jgi:hypothetical protein
LQGILMVMTRGRASYLPSVENEKALIWRLAALTNHMRYVYLLARE